MADKKKKNSGLALACFILGLLVVLILFLVKKDQMFSNLKETNFFGRVFGETPEFIQNYESEHSEEKIPLGKESEVVINIQEDIKSEPVPIIEPKNNESTKKIESEDKSKESKVEQKKENKTEEKKVEKKVEYTTYQLCFVEIDSDGSVNRKIIKRSVEKNDSPLTTAINLLIKGPDTKNTEEKKCMSLIPEGTKLLSAKVSNGVAYLNFNDAFEINPVGVEGYIGQLMQIVYTATNFSTVTSVQFMIEGQIKDYLGSEGQYIGSPLNRNSFSK